MNREDLEEGRWERRAACLDHDATMWDGEDEYTTNHAKKICRTECPVRSNCLIHAMINDEEGVWGGHTKEQRGVYKARWMEAQGDHLDLLKSTYRRKNFQLDGRYEARLEKAKICRRVLSPWEPGYEDYMLAVDAVISQPEATAEALGKRVGKSWSWVTHTLQEAWEMVS